MIEPIRDRWVIALAAATLRSRRVIVWWQSRR
jgi:hypothetical protein